MIEMIRVAIVDDHPIALRGLEQVLAEAGGFDVLASVATPAELAEHMATAGPAASYPDVILLDLYPGDDAPCLEAISELSARFKVLVISASGRPCDVLGAIRSGARGYVTKQSSTAMIVSAVETAAAGGFYLSAKLADILHSELTRGEPPAGPGSGATDSPARALSPRE